VKKESPIGSPARLIESWQPWICYVLGDSWHDGLPSCSSLAALEATRTKAAETKVSDLMVHG